MGERRVAVVVEDDEDIRSLLEAVLQHLGFEVHIAATGEVGVELAEAHRPDLVTLDLGLPDIDGFEVARRIRRVSDAHIVMLSARAEEIDTIGGLIVTLAGRVPSRGELITGPGDLEFEVLDADPRRVKRLRLHRGPMKIAPLIPLALPPPSSGPIAEAS